MSDRHEGGDGHVPAKSVDDLFVEKERHGSPRVAMERAPEGGYEFHILRRVQMCLGLGSVDVDYSDLVLNSKSDPRQSAPRSTLYCACELS